ncbi:MAG TPA: ABC transporter permease [Mycobacteriales bacterium]|nr:ABC transporter permease [Mycobacteriales bacterium]
MPDTGELPRLVIVPRRRFSGVDLREALHYRDLLRAFAARDITLRYRQTVLGVAWVILQPLLGAVIFAFVFGRVAGLSSDGLPYVVFGLAGLLAWNIFSSILTRASISLTSVGPMVSKVYFPRIALPLSVLGSVLVDFAVGFALQIAVLVYYHVSPGWRVVLLPAWLLLVVSLSSGIGLVASALAVRYRDVLQVVPIAIQFLMFLSPVGYQVAAVPAGVRWAVGINPLTGILQGFRWSLLGRGGLDTAQVAWSVVGSLAALALGVSIFSSLERDFADVI